MAMQTGLQQCASQRVWLVQNAACAVHATAWVTMLFVQGTALGLHLSSMVQLWCVLPHFAKPLLSIQSRNCQDAGTSQEQSLLSGKREEASSKGVKEDLPQG